MEAVIFIGLQAAGKSTFYRQRFINSHIRLNIDMLKTRYREQLLFRACLEAKQPVVIDNTNPRICDSAHRGYRLKVPLGRWTDAKRPSLASQDDGTFVPFSAVTLRIARNILCSPRKASLALQAIISSPI